MEERPAAAEEERVLRDLLAYYAARGAEGRLAACDEAALKARARRLLEPRRRRGGLDVRGVAERCRRAHGQRGGGGGGVLRDLLKALEVLELLCVNLLLAPWRKEIRSLKVGGPEGGEARPGPAGGSARGGAGEGGAWSCRAGPARVGTRPLLAPWGQVRDGKGVGRRLLRRHAAAAAAHSWPPPRARILKPPELQVPQPQNVTLPPFLQHRMLARKSHFLLSSCP